MQKSYYWFNRFAWTRSSKHEASKRGYQHQHGPQVKARRAGHYPTQHERVAHGRQVRAYMKGK